MSHSETLARAACGQFGAESTEAQRVIVTRSRALCRAVWPDQIEGSAKDSAACLYRACSLQMVLAREFGIRAMLQAGTCSWPMVSEDDGESATHFTYKWEGLSSPAVMESILAMALPELHVWLALAPDFSSPHVESFMIIDTTTGTWPERARLAEHAWTADAPPDFFWGTVDDLIALSKNSLGALYEADLEACKIADAFARHGIYQPLTDALGVQ